MAEEVHVPSAPPHHDSSTTETMDAEKVSTPKAASPVADPVAPPPAVNTRGSVYGRRKASVSDIVSLVFRGLVLVFSLIAFSTMAADSDTVDGYEVRFNDLSSFNYLVAVNVIVCVYSAAILAFSVFLLVTKKAFNNRFGLLSMFSIDLILAFLLISCSSAAPAELGTGECVIGSYSFSSFCSQARAAIAMSFLAFFSHTVAMLLSGHRASAAVRGH